jgi:NTE family protein
MAEFDLCFEGGGAKGSVFVGALKVFEERGHTVRRVVGTSAGAITATLIAAGYDAAEMLAATQEKVTDSSGNKIPRFATFMDPPSKFDQATIENSLTYDIFRSIDVPFLSGRIEGWLDGKIFDQLTNISVYREVFSFVERGGLYAGDEFLNWIKEKLNAKQPGWGELSMKQFFDATGKDLSMVASDTGSERLLVINHRTAPGVPVADAVRMSMSIPFVWQEVLWQKKWGSYLGDDISGDTIVDGGALSNFPIDLLISGDKSVREVMGDTDPDGARTLGLLIDEKIAVAGAPPRPSLKEKGEGDGLLASAKHLRTVNRVTRLMDTMMGAHDKQVIAAHEGKVCRLPAAGYGTTEFDMSDERLRALIDAGSSAMAAYFKNLQG